MKRYIIGCIAALSITMAVANTGCKNAQQAESGIFTAEQIVCMVIGLTAGSLTGTAEVIAEDMVQACGIAPTLTQDIVNFINTFNNLAPTKKEQWKTWALSHQAK
jgi:hypothetical protein